MPTFDKKILLAAILGVFLGALIVFGIRWFTYEPEASVHHHANFAVYINGEREPFAEPLYYEESSGVPCTLDEVKTPTQRVHMHGGEGDIVHVHDNAVTWGNFFQNIGWNIDRIFIKTNAELYRAQGDNRLVFILNGEEVLDITNRLIESEDKLLVSYGEDQDTDVQYASIESTAGEHNTKPDPAGCSGATEPTLGDRLRALF